MTFTNLQNALEGKLQDAVVILQAMKAVSNDAPVPSAPVAIQSFASPTLNSVEVQATVRDNGFGDSTLHIQRQGQFGAKYTKADVELSYDEASAIRSAIDAGGDRVTTSLAGSSTRYLKGTYANGIATFAGLSFNVSI